VWYPPESWRGSRRNQTPADAAAASETKLKGPNVFLWRAVRPMLAKARVNKTNATGRVNSAK
jgi:hypothetical protein